MNRTKLLKIGTHKLDCLRLFWTSMLPSSGRNFFTGRLLHASNIFRGTPTSAWSRQSWLSSWWTPCILCGNILMSSRSVRRFLNGNSPDRRIGCRGSVEWASRSLDLTPCDFCLWGYSSKVRFMPEEQEIFMNSRQVANIPVEVLADVRSACVKRWLECHEKCGSHIEEKFWRKEKRKCMVPFETPCIYPALFGKYGILNVIYICIKKKGFEELRSVRFVLKTDGSKYILYIFFKFNFYIDWVTNKQTNRHKSCDLFSLFYIYETYIIKIPIFAKTNFQQWTAAFYSLRYRGIAVVFNTISYPFIEQKKRQYIEEIEETHDKQWNPDRIYISY